MLAAHVKKEVREGGGHNTKVARFNYIDIERVGWFGLLTVTYRQSTRLLVPFFPLYCHTIRNLTFDFNQKAPGMMIPNLNKNADNRPLISSLTALHQFPKPSGISQNTCYAFFSVGINVYGELCAI